VDFNNAVVVASYSDHATAEAAVSLLKSEGIEAAVSADDAGGEMPNLDLASGARVIVEEKDAELARGLLNANEASS
jgi:hypothetical protein